jgi:hypothetical protein
MSGIVVMRAVLAADAPLVAACPADQIVADDLPIDIALPALSVTLISSVDRKVLQRGSVRRVTERVQVTVMARDATERLELVALVRSAAAARIGDFADVADVSIQTESRGPDMTTEGGIRVGMQDFLVSFNEAT